MEPTTGTTVVTMPSERAIHLARIFDAPRDRVWRAFTEPELVARWWGRGNPLDVEEMDVRAGGHWRFVEHGPEGVSGFEGRFGEVVSPARLSQTFDWDGMPGRPSVQTATFEDLGDGRTEFAADTIFFTKEDRDGMMGSGMEEGMNLSYAALDRLLATME